MRGIEQFLQVDAATLGALKYAGTWNASTNTPTLASGVGVQGQYYVVSVAGSTNLDGETSWGVGDWAVFNGSVWQKVDGGSTGLLTTLTVTGNTFLATTSGNVGVGTTSPQRLLVVDGGASGAVLQLTNNAAGNTAGNGLELVCDGANAFFSNRENGYCGFATNNIEQMRITSTGNLGIGTSSPTARLHVVGTTQSVTGSTGIQIYGDGGSGYVNSIGANPLIFQVNTTERMRIDSSGNLLVGTTSANGTITVSRSGNGNRAYFTNTADADFAINLSSGVTLLTPSTGTLAFGTSNTERMRLDSAGNLGLGVTPSAWGTLKALELGGSGGSYVAAAGVVLYTGANNFYNGTNYIYKTTGAASQYQQIGGQHQWFTAPSGTAGNAISFNQPMTLDASGILLVGRTSAGGSAIIDAQSDANGVIRVRGGTASGQGAAFFGTSGSDTTRFAFGQVSRILGGTPNDDAVFFASGYLALAPGGSEKARITSGGDVGIGTTSVNSRLQVTNNADSIYQIRTTNSSTGTAARSAILFVNDTGDAGFVGAHGSGTAAGIGFPNATVLQSNLSAGVAVVSSNASGGIVFHTGGTGSANERLRITSGGNLVQAQPAESAQNASVTLSVANLQAGIITSNAAVTLTLPTGTSLESYTTGMAANTAFECTFIATTANAITIAANGNTTVGNLTVSGNTSGTFRFRKTAANTFTVYRVA